MERALVVVDLLLGDAGKGLLTDVLVRERGARWVVRYNGGAQAGHHVVTGDGRRHTFAQVGAGSFVPGVRTLLGPAVVVHPLALGVELGALAELGVRPEVWLSAECRLVTPYHQAANRLRELARGAGRHGSCGAGVGEVVVDDRLHPGETVRAGHRLTRELLERIRTRKRAEVLALFERVRPSPEAMRELSLFDDPALPARYLEAVRAVLAGKVLPREEDRALLDREPGPVVFEGAQGVLLDERFGFHPFSTWSNCRADHALDLAGEAPVELYGVLRAHAYRHGPGPLPTEAPGPRARYDHNATNPWQGTPRSGPFDGVLARHGLAIEPRVQALCVTHLDGLEGGFPHARAYARALPPPSAWGEVAEAPEQALALTRQLDHAEPVLETAPAAEAAERIAALLDRPVRYRAFGPRAEDVRTTGGSAAPSCG